MMFWYLDLDARCHKLHRSMATELEAPTSIFRIRIRSTSAPASLNDFKLVANRY